MLITFARIVPGLVAVCSFGAIAAMAQQQDSLYWRPYLDAPAYEQWGASTGYVLPAKSSVASWKDVGVWEIDAWGYLYYHENDLGGDLDVRAKLDMDVLNGYDGISSGYPLTMARIQLRYAQRYLEGYGAQFLFEPGLYSALEQISSKDLGFPLGVIGTKEFGEELGIQFGLRIFPGFDHVVDPVIGVRWTRGQLDVGPVITIDVGYPETRLEIRASDAFYMELGATMSLWPEYQMDENDPRERVSFDESRMYLGFGFAISETLNLTTQFGYALNREIEFDKAAPSVDLDDAFLFRIGVSGRL